MPLDADAARLRLLSWSGIGCLLVLGALFLGVLATTADPVLILMGVGTIGAAFLLAAPKLVIWLVLALSLSTGALISMAGPAALKLPWAISMSTFLLWPVALLQLAQQRRTPMFVWIALLLVLKSILSSLLQWHAPMQFAAGFKRYFQSFGLLFSFAALAFSAQDYGRWRRLLVGIALLQLPFCLYEFFVLVPLRGGLAAGSEVTDVVAGSFAANLEGGSANAEMAAFLLIVLAFLAARWRAGLLRSAPALLLAAACIAPLGFGETKIVVVLLPLMALILLRRDVMRAPLRYLPWVILIGLLTIGLAYVYATMNGRSFEQVLDMTMKYNVESTGYGANLLNRTTVLSFWWSQQGMHDPFGFFFGNGLGSAFWGPGNPVNGQVALRFPHYGIDLTTASTLLWDVGVAGLGLYLGMMLAAWLCANRILRRTSDPLVVADTLSIQAALAVFVVYVFYGSSSLSILQFQVIIAATLGYLAHFFRITCDSKDLQ